MAGMDMKKNCMNIATVINIGEFELYICIYLYLYVWANVCAISPMMIYQNMSPFIHIKTQMFHFVYQNMAMLPQQLALSCVF